MTTTFTRWGDPKDPNHIFHDTPFGTVELINFRKVAPEMFNVHMNVYSPRATLETMEVIWGNCHAEDAYAYFGIGISEQNMWGQ
jgi:hypothetical protein